MTKKRYTKKHYADAIAALGLSQVGAAKMLGVDDRTSRRWISGERSIPHVVHLFLQLMISKKIKPEDLT